MRVHKIDSITIKQFCIHINDGLIRKDINNALNFVWACGVQTKVKPSAENLVDMDEKSILGLIWAVSLFVRVDEIEESKLDSKIFSLDSL